jgi:hypothetical protein
VLVLAVSLPVTSVFSPVARLDRRGQEDWRGAVRFVDGHLATRRLPVFVRSGLIEAEHLRDGVHDIWWDFCLLPVTSIYRFQHRPAELVPLPTTVPGRLTPAQLDLLIERGGAWFLIRGTDRDADATVAQVASRLRTRGWTAGSEARRAFGLVTAVRIGQRR